MKDVLIKFLEKHNINLVNKSVCIGVSTGVDSMVLLHNLLNIRKEFNLNIIVCHVNHGKRQQSIEEEQFIIDFCKQNELLLEVLHIDLNQIKDENFQNSARNKRLEFFNNIMNKYNSNILFLAHHLNDDIETAFMHIIRGSNVKGYSGIDEVVYNKDNKMILRPFLSVLKQDIIESGIKNNVKYYEDSSNSSDVYTRNRIRHNLIPLLFEENSSFSKQFLEFKDNLLNCYEIVCEKRNSFINDFVIIKDDFIEFDVNDFKNLNDFMKTEVLFELLKQYDLSKKNVLEIIKLINTNKANLIIDYKNINFCKQYDKILLKKINDLNNNIDNIVIDKCGLYDINDKYELEVIEFDEEDFKKNKNILINLNVIWYNSSSFPFIVRNRKNGDKMKLSCGTKKVKDILIDEKIAINDRDNLLLIEKDNEIINIFGVKKSETLLKNDNNNILVTLREKK